jgi:serine/threonine protein kinase/WD40 repeat protein
MLRTRCTHCDKPLKLKPDAISKNVRCPHCRKVFQVNNVAASATESIEAKHEVLVTRSKPEPVSPCDSADLQDASQQEQEAWVQEEVCELPTQIGRYRVQSVLGRGAFGVVYVAHDDVLSRDVAIKLCINHRAASDSDAESEQRLLAEARAAARLRHPNVVAVYEAGTHEGQVYLVSELVTGESLADRIAKDSVSARDAAILIRDLARGLHYAHSQNLVHRDVKPQNILIDLDNRPQIADFGLAFDRSNEEEFREQAYSRSGTLAYMAPEQAGVVGVSVGPASDQYSLGATLFELLTGCRPHLGSSVEILQALEAKNPPRARASNPKIDQDLDAICAKAMAHEPWQRYENCEELARDLERYLAGELIRGRRIGIVERVQHFSKRKPQVAAWAAAIAAIFLAVFAYTTGKTIQNVFSNRQLASAANNLNAENNRRSETLDSSSRELADMLGGDASSVRDSNESPGMIRNVAQPQNPRELAGWVAYSRKLQKASKSLTQSELVRANRLLRETIPAYQNWEHRFLDAASGHPSVTWKLPSQEGDFRNAPKVNKLITLTDPTVIGVHSDAKISFFDLVTGKEIGNVAIPLRSTGARECEPFPLRSKSRLLFSDGEVIRNWDYQNSKESELTIGAQNRILGVTEDDRWMLVEKNPARFGGAVISSNGFNAPVSKPLPHELELWDINKGVKVTTLGAELFQIAQGPDSQNYGRMSFGPNFYAVASSDSSHFLISANEKLFRLSMVPLDNESVPIQNRTPELHRFSVENVRRILTVLPNLTGCLYVDTHANLCRLEVNDLGISDSRVVVRNLRALSDAKDIVTGLNSSGEPLIAITRGNELLLIDEQGTLPLYRASQELYEIPTPVFSANGKYLIGGDGKQFQVWDLDSLQPALIGDSETMVSAMAQASDGRFAAIGFLDGGLELRDMDSHQPVWIERKGNGELLHAISFHPTEPIMATGGSHGVVRFHAVSDGKVLREWSALPAPISALEFSPNGETLAVGLSERICERTEPLGDFGSDSPPPAPAAPAAPTASSTSDNVPVSKFVAFQGRPSPSKIMPVEFNLLFFSTASGEHVGQFKTHEIGVTSLGFSPDGSRLASCGEDGKVALWDVQQASKIAEYQCEPGGVPTDLRFAPDGNQIAVVVADHSVRFVPEVRTLQLTVAKQVCEMKTRMVNVEICIPVTETVTREVDYEGTRATEEFQITKMKVETQTIEESYEVTKPYLEIVTQSYTFFAPQKWAGPGADDKNPTRPHIVTVQANDLVEQTRWYPEGSATPKSITYQADGSRLYASTDQGISVLHPMFLFELVELRPSSIKAVATSFGKLLFSTRHEKLLVSGVTKPDFDYQTLGNLFVLAAVKDKREDAMRTALRGTDELKKTQSDLSKIEQARLSSNPAIANWNGEWIEIPKKNSLSNKSISGPSTDRKITLADVTLAEKVAMLTQIKPTKQSPEGFDMEASFVADGHPFAPAEYLPAPAGSLYQYDIPDGWSTLHTTFALSSKEPTGAAVFVIRGDGSTLYRSPIIRDQKLHGIRVDVRGVRKLEFVSEYIDRGREQGKAAWLQPKLSRNLEGDCYSIEFDEVRISGTELDHCEIVLSKTGFQLKKLLSTEPTLNINGVQWKPSKDTTLPNQGRSKFISDSADLSRARLHALRIGEGGNLIYNTSQDAISLLFVRPSNGSTDFECVLQIPRIGSNVTEKELVLSPIEWIGDWKAAGIALSSPEGGGLPPEVSTKGVRPFAIQDLSSLDWSWPEERSALANTPEQGYAIVGQRRFRTSGGHFRVEAMGDDAVRVAINGKVVIDNWVPGGVRHNSSLINLGAGEHTIRVEHYKPIGRSRLFVDLRPIEPAQFAAIESLAVKPMDMMLASDSKQVSAPLARNLDRETAERLLKKRTMLTLRLPDGKTERVSSVESLPVQPCTLIGIWGGEINDNDLIDLDQQGMLAEFDALGYFSGGITAAGLRALQNKKSITDITLWYSKVEDIELAKLLSSLPRIRNLSLRNTTVSDATLEVIARLPVTSLNISYSKVADVGLRNLRQKTQLTSLDLSGTKVSEQVLLEVLPSLTKLNSLNLNELQVSDQVMEVIAKLPIQDSLGLSKTQVTDKGLALLAGKKIRSIFLSETGITNQGLLHLRDVFQGTNASSLELAKTQISDEGLRHLEGQSCWILDLSDTKITDDGLKHLEKLQFVRYMRLNRTSVTEEGVKSLQNKFPEAEIAK